MADRILVAGDVHLGSENANADAFDDFLEDVHDGAGRTDQLVLLGDVWDLVRRDSFGCAWETSETVTRIKRLAEELPVHVLLGNHDSHLRHLDAALYEVDFREDHVAESGGVTIRFRHGNEFDRFQSDALSAYLSGPGDRGDVDPTRGAKDPYVAAGRDLVRRGKRRLRSALDAVRDGDTALDAVRQPAVALAPPDTDVADGAGQDAETAGADATGSPYARRERRAHAYLETIPEDKLVYGHTHAPYVRADNGVANPGSWKATAPLHDTYLVVEDGEVTLYRYDRSGPDEELGARP